ncbi:hypothetical protein B1B_15703, partial [mine drainage metagenome]
PVQGELHRILTSKFRIPAGLWQLLASRLCAFEHAPSATFPLDMPITDPDDTPILACALAAKADVFVTGDKALLNLLGVKEMPILSPRQLWQKLSGLSG